MPRPKPRPTDAVFHFTWKRMLVLSVCSGGDEVSVLDVVKQARMHRNAANRVLLDLEARGFVSRRRTAHNRCLWYGTGQGYDELVLWIRKKIRFSKKELSEARRNPNSIVSRAYRLVRRCQALKIVDYYTWMGMRYASLAMLEKMYKIAVTKRNQRSYLTKCLLSNTPRWGYANARSFPIQNWS